MHDPDDSPMLGHVRIDDPMERFGEALKRARAGEPHDGTAGVLATADAAGRPSARVILLKGLDEGGLLFFTNWESRKGRDLAVNPHGALCFYWPSLGEQVRLEGPVERLSAAESDAYFATRPRGSQIGAWASRQSEPVESREELEGACQESERRFEGRDVPRPSYWGGYRLQPRRVEFWFDRKHRMHDRFLYVREDAGWQMRRLSP